MTEVHVLPHRPALARAVAAFLGVAIQRTVKEREWCFLALSGGSTLRAVYRELAILQLPWSRIEFWFTDERGVPVDHPASNYGSAEDVLFADPRIGPHQLHRIEAERPDVDAACAEYERELPDDLDLALVALEPDGTICALHPGAAALAETERRVLPVGAPRVPRRRVTLTPPALAEIDRLVVVAEGRERAPAVRAALAETGDPQASPGRLARRGTWFLDAGAAAEADR